MVSFLDLQKRLEQKHIPALDGIRAVSVFSVIWYHFGADQFPGVSTFFVLSGFLITWLLLGERAMTGTISLSGFYKRRALRIFPAFYAYWIGVMILLFLAKKTIPWGNAASALVFVGNYYSGLNHHPANAFSHTWSLAIEEQFYLLWPALFLLWRHDLRKMTNGLLALIGAVWLFRAVLCYGFDVDQSYIYASFETRCDNLLVGCLAAVLIKRGVGMRIWEMLIRHAILPLVTLFLVVSSVKFGGLFIPRYRDVVGFAVQPVLLAILIVQLVALSGSFIWKWLDSAPMRFIGRISYPLYLYQQMTLWPVQQRLKGYPIEVQFVVASAVTILVASMSYYVVERPFLRLKGKGAPRAKQKENELSIPEAEVVER